MYDRTYVLRVGRWGTGSAVIPHKGWEDLRLENESKTRDVAQWGGCLPSVCEAPGSIPGIVHKAGVVVRTCYLGTQEVAGGPRSVLATWRVRSHPGVCETLERETKRVGRKIPVVMEVAHGHPTVHPPTSNSSPGDSILSGDRLAPGH